MKGINGGRGLGDPLGKGVSCFESLIDEEVINAAE